MATVPAVSDSATTYAASTIFWQNATATNFPANGHITADCVIEERGEDTSIVTENPVETGSVVSDHAYDLPIELDLLYSWSPASLLKSNGKSLDLSGMYQQLLGLKTNKILCAVATIQRLYQSMLVIGLSQTTDKDTANILTIRVVLRQIIFASTTTVAVASSSQMTYPNKTGPVINGGTVQLQPATNFNSGP